MVREDYHSEECDCDKTLASETLQQYAEERGMIENFEPECASGASYDFRVGEKVIVARPEADQHKIEFVKDQQQISIKPGNAYTIYSRERVSLPPNIQGRLSLKFRLASKKLFYSGGLIDPGYEGYLFFTIFNLSSSEYTFKYEDPIASGEFKRIEKTDKPYDRGEMDSLPDEMLPKQPELDHRIRNWEQMNSALSDHEKQLSNVQERVRNIDSTLSEVETRLQDRMADIDNRLNSLLHVAIASIIAGVAAGLTIQLWRTLL